MSTLKVNNLQDVSSDAVITNGVIVPAALPAGSILQVVSATKTDTFTTASGTYVDLTGLSVSVTPSSANSKILVMFTVNTVGDGNVIGTQVQIVRDSTPIGIGDASGDRSRTSSALYFGNDSSNSNSYGAISNQFLDSPAATSSLVYKLQIRTTGNATFVNRSTLDSDTAGFPRSVSTITVMEVAG